MNNRWHVEHPLNFTDLLNVDRFYEADFYVRCHVMRSINPRIIRNWQPSTAQTSHLLAESVHEILSPSMMMTMLSFWIFGCADTDSTSIPDYLIIDKILKRHKLVDTEVARIIYLSSTWLLVEC